MSDTTYTVHVGDDKAGLRLDRLLAEALPQHSRNRLQALIQEGGVREADVAAVRDPAVRVRAGATYEVAVPAATAATLEPQPLALAVVYEDDDVIVVDKPAGLVVHPGAGNADHTLVNALLAHCQGRLATIGGPLRPGIVHRLDKDTSGLLVAAKTDGAYMSLVAQFSAHSVQRVYHAAVWGVPPRRHGHIDAAIGRDPRHRKRMAVVRTGGKPAKTGYRVMARYGDGLASLAECRPYTGRTHQIRVHMAASGHPLIGDALYGGGPRRASVTGDAVRGAVVSLGRQALHAHLIGFLHPARRVAMSFTSDFPSDFRMLIDTLEHL